MYCIYKPFADCIACGGCDGGEREKLWDFSAAQGRESFLEDLWNFIFSGDMLTKRKSVAMQLLLQSILEELEQEILCCAEKHVSQH